MLHSVLVSLGIWACVAASSMTGEPAYRHTPEPGARAQLQDSLFGNWFGATGDCTLPIASLVAQLDTLALEDREARIKELVFAGNVPGFMNHWARVSVEAKTNSGKVVSVAYYVTPDYLAVGCDADFFRVPLTPQAGQAIADRFNCFLPTRKMVDDIYQAAEVKLAPVPLTAERERVATFYAHHGLIEQQRNGRQGLIAGIKKDVVRCNAVANDERPNRVAIYGWHKKDGNPIQPLYTGHVDHYVDYSHGIRLVYAMIEVGDRWVHYRDALADPELKGLLCDETECDVYVYQ